MNKNFLADIVEQLERKARKEALSGEQFNELVQKAEKLFDYDPKVYKIVVGVLAGIGYAYILLFLLLAIWGAMTFGQLLLTGQLFSFVAVQAILLFGVLGFIIAKSLFVEFRPPSGISPQRSQAPELFQLIDSLKAKFGVEIDEILINADLNACIVQIPRLGMLGWHKNYLVVGLPLLYANDVERLTAILAHEIGHLSGSHGKFSAWIYTVVRSWSTLLQELSRTTELAYIAFFPFYCWYYPRFAAYAHVINRQHEIEADRAATLLTNRKTNAEGLIAVHLQAYYLSEKFWPKLGEFNIQNPDPPKTIMVAMSEHLQRPDISEQEVQQWYTQCLNEKNNPADPHPCLTERLLDIGYPARDKEQLKDVRIDLLPLLTITKPAAETLLGPYARKITRVWGKLLQIGVSELWHKEYACAVEQRKKLEEMEKRLGEGRLPEKEWLRLGMLVHKFKSHREAIPIYINYLERKPDDAKTKWHLGYAVLELEDERGVELIQEAMDSDVRYVGDGCQLAMQYYDKHNQVDKSEQYKQRLLSHNLRMLDVYEERKRIKESDVFLAHDLDAAIVEKLRSCLAQYDQVKAAFLVKRQLTHMPEMPQYVLGIQRHFSFSMDKQQLVQFLLALESKFEDTDIDFSLKIVDLLEHECNLFSNFGKVAGCQIYGKTTVLV